MQISNITYFSDYDVLKDIPNQYIFNWIKRWNVTYIIPESVDTPENLYVMSNEKYIWCQDLENNLMIKSLNIDKYQKLNDFKNNNYNIFNIYMNSYSNDEVLSIKREIAWFFFVWKNNTTSIPILKRGEVTLVYNELHQLIY